MRNRKSPVRLTLLATLTVLVELGTDLVSAIKGRLTNKVPVMNPDHILRFSSRVSRQRRATIVAAWVAVMAIGASAFAPAHAQIVRTLYAAKFTCGAQGALSTNSPTPLETGTYAFDLGVFNASSTPSNTISVFAALPGDTPVFVESYSLPAYGNESTDCAEILSALGVIATPNAVLGYVHLLRQTDDVEVQATYTRTASTNGAPASTPVGGASVDVERIEPRVIEITLALSRLQ